jgi:anti-anti-sigma factor
LRAEHHPAYDNGVLRITQLAAPAGLAIAGEIDEATYPALVTCLHELAEGRPVVHLDLGAVSYCDLAGLRAIVRLAARDAAARPRRVVLHGVPQHIRLVLAITGWDALPGLSVEP